MSNGSIRFVTRRAALTYALLTAFGAASLALAAGAVLGVQWAQRSAAGQHGAQDGVERDYLVRELGRLNAAMAQIDPRIDRLVRRVGELGVLQTRLQGSPTPSRPPAAPADRPALDGQGGPELPPRHCVGKEARLAHDNSDVDRTRRQIACVIDELSRLERSLTPYALAYAAWPGRLPVEQGARYESSFGNRLDPFTRGLRFHSGVDFSAPTGTAIFATAGGRVTFAGMKSGYGLTVEVDHGNHFATRYAHASRVLVQEGDVVLPRQHIADVGSTGRSTGPHLHFEVLERGDPVDPEHFLSLFQAESFDG